MSVRVGIEEMVRAGVVLVDALLHEAHAEQPGVEVEVLLRVAADRGDVMNAGDVGHGRSHSSSAVALTIALPSLAIMYGDAPGLAADLAVLDVVLRVAAAGVEGDGVRPRRSTGRATVPARVGCAVAERKVAIEVERRSSPAKSCHGRRMRSAFRSVTIVSRAASEPSRIALITRHARPARGPHADGAVARLPHRLRRDRDRDAGADGAGRVALAAHGRRRVSPAREAMGERAARSCSPSARCRAPCCRSSSGCCGRASCSSPARSSACRSRSRGSRSSPKRSSSASICTAGSGSRRARTSRPA